MPWCVVCGYCEHGPCGGVVDGDNSFVCMCAGKTKDARGITNNEFRPLDKLCKWCGARLENHTELDMRTCNFKSAEANGIVQQLTKAPIPQHIVDACVAMRIDPNLPLAMEAPGIGHSDECDWSRSNYAHEGNPGSCIGEPYCNSKKVTQ